MKSVANLTVPQNVNALNQKRLERKNPKRPEKSLKHQVMDLVISLVTNPTVIVATQIVPMNVPKSPMLTIYQHPRAMMTFLLQKHHFLNASTLIGALGLHAVLPASIVIIREQEHDHEIVTKHQIVNAKTIYMKRKNVQLMTQLLLVSLFIIFETARTVDFFEDF